MTLALVILQDKSTDTGAWIIGPFMNAFIATDWAEANIPSFSDWHIDELTSCADIPKELLKL